MEYSLQKWKKMPSIPNNFSKDIDLSRTLLNCYLIQ